MPVNKSFKMKNYTTDISADRSILEIEKFLTLFGAEAVMLLIDPDWHDSLAREHGCLKLIR